MNCFIKLLVFVFSIAFATSARADRWLLQTTDISYTGFQQLSFYVFGGGGTILFNIYYPQEGVVAIVADYPPGNPPALPVINPNGTITGEPDVQLSPDASVGVSSTGNWAVPSLTTGVAPLTTAPGYTSPTIYLPDTGVTTSHSELASNALNFQPGISAASDYTNPEYTVPLDPVPDTGTHGTAMASVIGGQNCGILGPLQVQTKVVPVSIYDKLVNGVFDQNTWASTVLNAMLMIISDHRSRIANTPYARNHASIVCFAHSTTGTTYRIGFLDTVMQRAWDAGITVIMSAGNRSILAGKVSPAAADWGYQPSSGPVLYPPFTGNPTTSNFVRDSTTLPSPLPPRFIVAGARTQSGALWTSSNTNNTTGKVVDLLAPGAAVLAANNGTPSLLEGNGTSYSTGFATAASAYVAFIKPWATPNQIRTALVPASVPTPPALPPSLTLPQTSSSAITGISMTYAQWIAHYTKANGSPLAGEGGNPTADPDDDGMANLMEYYTGLDPKFTEPRNAPIITFDMTARTLTLRVVKALYLPSTGPSPQLQTSTTLDEPSWTNVSIALTPSSPVVELGDGIEYTGTITIPAGDRRFYRVSYAAP